MLITAIIRSICANVPILKIILRRFWRQREEERQWEIEREKRWHHYFIFPWIEQFPDTILHGRRTRIIHAPIMQWIVRQGSTKNYAAYFWDHSKERKDICFKISKVSDAKTKMLRAHLKQSVSTTTGIFQNFQCEKKFPTQGPAHRISSNWQ